jgi:hypothetical protein
VLTCDLQVRNSAVVLPRVNGAASPLSAPSLDVHSGHVTHALPSSPPPPAQPAHVSVSADNARVNLGAEVNGPVQRNDNGHQNGASSGGISGVVASGAESTMRKLASSRMQLELERDRLRESEIRSTHSGRHHAAEPVANGGYHVATVNGGFANQKPVTTTIHEQPKKKSCFVEPSPRRATLKQVR